MSRVPYLPGRVVVLLLALLGAAHAAAAPRAAARPTAPIITPQPDDGPPAIQRRNTPFPPNVNDASAGSYIVIMQKPAAVGGDPAMFRAAFPRRSTSAAAAQGAAAASVVPAQAGRRAAAEATVERYSEQLRGEHDALLASVAGAAGDGRGTRAGGPGARVAGGQARITRHYTHTLNGFAVSGLTDAQAAALARSPRVLSVTASRMYQLQTISTPHFLGLSGAGGVWDSVFGGAGAAGDVLIASIDTGIHTTASSFSAVARTSPLPSWWKVGPNSPACAEGGTCTPGKLLGCQYYDQEFASIIGRSGYVRPANDIATCQDRDGHGSHTSATAGGNFAAPALASGLDVSPSNSGMSGMAPGASVAGYKVFWTAKDSAGRTFVGAYDADIVAAIEQATKDGADVINFSVGGYDADTTWEVPAWQAFRGAAEAGVFIACAAGNSGPYPGSVDNNMPWVTTVAAGTHPRANAASFTLFGAGGGDVNYTGASAATIGVGPATVYYAGPTDRDAARCFTGTLTAAAAGKIVLCERGENARVDKSAEVLRAGGVGMILVNVPSWPSDTQDADVSGWLFLGGG
jgi:hypothetical protein